MTVDTHAHAGRLDRVETEVSSIRTDIGGLKSELTGLKGDVRGLGSILQRIEEGVSQAQQRFETDKRDNRINPVAMASVLITIISILVGGAWLIGGQLSGLAVRTSELANQRVVDAAERVIIERRIERMENMHMSHVYPQLTKAATPATN